MFSITFVNICTGREGLADDQDYPSVAEARKMVAYFRRIYHKTIVFMPENVEENLRNYLSSMATK